MKEIINEITNNNWYFRFVSHISPVIKKNIIAIQIPASNNNCGKNKDKAYTIIVPPMASPVHVNPDKKQPKSITNKSTEWLTIPVIRMIFGASGPLILEFFNK